MKKFLSEVRAHVATFITRAVVISITLALVEYGFLSEAVVPAIIPHIV